ncbi:hypothetical protein CIW49_18320 [Mycolicibacterium sp. P1-18]|nr:hypothetical protein CIW49_18320 [Mycolicibacterium sp. P1-18]
MARLVISSSAISSTVSLAASRTSRATAVLVRASTALRTKARSNWLNSVRIAAMVRASIGGIQAIDAPNVHGAMAIA